MPDLITPQTTLAIVAVLAYLLGSVPFGIVMARLFGLGDLRTIGSGNIGATNVLRTGNKLAAFLTLILDAGKGAIAVVAARLIIQNDDAVQIAGLAAFLGHLFPIYLKFRGGKGVATFLGTVLALSFPLGLAACGTWLAVAVITRYSSLSALVSVASLPVWILTLNSGPYLILSFALMLLIYIRHWPNIRRLKAGTETKIGKKG